MGQTITAWRARVKELVRDASGTDLSDGQVDEVGIKPALGKYSVDHPRLEVTEVAGAGSPYLSLPTGWLSGFSRIESIEFPARENPPQLLDGQSWRITRDPSSVAVEKILLDRSPTSAQYVRFQFTLPWPTPTSTSTDDKVDDVAFNAVTALAASFLCVQLATQAAKGRSGSLPTDFSPGTERSRMLIEAAKTNRGIYDSFLGFAEAGQGGQGQTSSDVAPASRTMDYDPARYALFHGGRR